MQSYTQVNQISESFSSLRRRPSLEKSANKSVQNVYTKNNTRRTAWQLSEIYSYLHLFVLSLYNCFYGYAYSL